MQGILDDFRKGEKMNKKVYCEVCGEEFTARAYATRQKYCDDCRPLIYGERQPCIKCGKMVNKTNLTGICCKCRDEMRNKRHSKASISAEKEIAKSLDNLDLVVLENEEYNRTHDQALSYGYYVAMREGYFKPL